MKPSKQLRKNSAGGQPDYDIVLKDVSGFLEQARKGSARVINAFMTAAYWWVGERIVKWEQAGRAQAVYGDELVSRLADDLSTRFGRGFSKSNLYLMRSFHLAYRQIFQTVSGKSRQTLKKAAGATADAASPPNIQTIPSQLTTLTIHFPLPWSHYVRLLSVKERDARDFYEAEAIRGGWTVRQLNRQIDSLFYQRTLLSRNKSAMLLKGEKPISTDIVSVEEQVKDPFVLEFLGLEDEYSENQLEESLIRHLESFLLELGGDFTFVGRQKRLRIGHQWFRIDLLFFHRKLRCLVIIDLKTGEFTHADAGQMHLYCNYAAEHWSNTDENPPVGLILCAEKDSAVAHYALDNLPNKILAAEYRTKLPAEKMLIAEVVNTRRMLEGRRTIARQRHKKQ